jgi:tetratricopeptide (TPR) repeat protein
MIASPARFFIPVLAAGILTLTGCGAFRNATAYFNTYYNASQLFNQAVAEVEKNPQTAKDSNYFAPYKVPPSAVTKFEKVIEKGSRVIQFHGESGYVEDAIMMIGKAYLYQNETESAAGKFRELIENFPESDKRPSATLWYAKALYQGNNDDQALTVAKELAAPALAGEKSDIPGNILLEVTMLQAQIYIDRGEYEQAAATLAATVPIDGDDALKAIAQYQLGTVYEQTKEYAKAAEAFGLIDDYGPAPSMKFNAELRKGVMLSMAGEPDAALNTFDEIIALPLKIEQSSLVDLEVANAYWARGDSMAAFTLYTIIDSSYKRTDVAARSYFKRGEIFEKHYRDMDSAKKYYEKAKSEYPSSSVTQPATARFTSLDHFVRTRERLADDDSALRALLNPDTLGKSDTSAAAAKPGDTTRGGIFSPGSDPSKKLAQDVKKEPPRPERVEPRPPPYGSDENLPLRAIRNRPRHLVPDPENMGQTAEGAQGGAPPVPPESAIAGKMSDLPTAQGQSKAIEKKEAAPSTPEGLRKRIAESEYEIGGIFLLDLGLPDSALAHYERLVAECPESPLVPKAIYAMSEVHRVLGDTAAVDSLYDRLLAEHPATDYARQVKIMRGLDTSGVAENDDAALYRKAEASLFSGESEKALTMFKQIAATTNDTLIAPKSRYTVGWIYENVLINLDSANAWYKSLLKEYPASVYATSAEPRVAVRQDTSKLSQYVKIKTIAPIPKPEKKAMGMLPKPGTPGRLILPPLPGDTTDQKEKDDEYFDPGDDEEPADTTDEDTGDDEPQQPDDDPGRPPSQ